MTANPQRTEGTDTVAPRPAASLGQPQPQRFRRQPRRVRPHASGSWTCSIGKVVSRDGAKLRPKDWYFPNVPEADAAEAANRIQGKWEFLCRNWGRLYQSRLELVGSRFAATPHWEPYLGAEPTTETPPTILVAPPTADEIAQQFANMTLRGVFALWQQQQQIATAQGDRQNVTRGAAEKNVRNALTYFDDSTRMDLLAHDVIQKAKGEMLAKLERRTVKNYMGALKGMLSWFYDSDYGKGFDRPSHFDTVFNVKGAVRTDIKTHSADDLAAMLRAASDRTKLFAMLGLNCGMYQSDIGRLTLDEINVDEGYVFWDREKEPQNPFRVRHDLWPETIVLVRKFVQQGGQPPRPFTDWRGGSAAEIDCARLAFVDRNGLPLYRVRENGDTYDKISEAWKDLKGKHAAAPRFHDLRKTTNQMLCELLEAHATDDEGLTAVGEISKMFLAQKTPLLARLYRQTAGAAYGRMNRYLAAVGDKLRTAKAFVSLPQN